MEMLKKLCDIRLKSEFAAERTSMEGAVDARIHALESRYQDELNRLKQRTETLITRDALSNEALQRLRKQMQKLQIQTKDNRLLTQPAVSKRTVERASSARVQRRQSSHQLSPWDIGLVNPSSLLSQARGQHQLRHPTAHAPVRYLARGTGNQ